MRERPWYRRFSYEVGDYSERTLFGNWRVAVVFYGVLGVLMLYATTEFFPSLFLGLVCLVAALMCWYYGRHLKGRMG